MDSTHTTLVQSLCARVTQFQQLNPSHPLAKAVDSSCISKSIPFLIALGSEDALQLKQDIIIFTNASRMKSSTAVVGLPDNYPYYPSVKAEGSSTLDWGVVCENNKNWTLQAKIDGSQLTFAVSDKCDPKQQQQQLIMSCGSKSCWNNKMFREARVALGAIITLLNPNLVYHSEFVSRLRHNITIYERLPRFFVQIYDIQEKDTKRFFTEEEIEHECSRVGLEKVQLFWDNARRVGSCAFLLSKTQTTNGMVDDPVRFSQVIIKAIMEGNVPADLGGIHEGLVLKHRSYYNLAKQDTTSKRRKFVTSDFRESRSIKKPQAPILSVSTHIEWIGSLFDIPARFRKAFQRIRDSDNAREEKINLASNSLFIESSLDNDLEKECKNEIISYLTGDFLLRCARNGDDVDQNDPNLPRFQTLGKMATDESIWREFRMDVFKAARKSLTMWMQDESVRLWIDELF